MKRTLVKQTHADKSSSSFSVVISSSNYFKFGLVCKQLCPWLLQFQLSSVSPPPLSRSWELNAFITIQQSESHIYFPLQQIPLLLSNPTIWQVWVDMRKWIFNVNKICTVYCVCTSCTSLVDASVLTDRDQYFTLPGAFTVVSMHLWSALKISKESLNV